MVLGGVIAAISRRRADDTPVRREAGPAEDRRRVVAGRSTGGRDEAFGWLMTVCGHSRRLGTHRGADKALSSSCDAPVGLRAAVADSCSHDVPARYPVAHVIDRPSSQADQSRAGELRSGEFFENFTHSVAAARLLLKRAHEQGSLIEGLVLYASSIDALLRNLVALGVGDRDGTTIQLDARYFVHDETKWMSERRLYAEALDAEVLTETEFRELEDLYTFRNAVIHRFITSGMTYAEITSRLDRYEVILRRLFERLAEIEQPDGEVLDEETDRRIRERVARKLGDA